MAQYRLPGYRWMTASEYVKRMEPVEILVRDRDGQPTLWLLGVHGRVSINSSECDGAWLCHGKENVGRAIASFFVPQIDGAEQFEAIAAAFQVEK